MLDPPPLDHSPTQGYNGVAIPKFDANNNLPPGMHDATMAEVQARFVHNKKRRQLFASLVQVVSILKESKCPEVYLDGSFITAKELPNDYDLCYEPTGMAPELI